jgi:hypothetical protein
MGDIAAICAEPGRSREQRRTEQSPRWHIANMSERIGKKVEETVK